MVITKSEEKARYALSLIGGGIEEEILRLAASRRMGASGIREIVLRSGGRSSVLFEEERIVLYSTLSPEQTEHTVNEFCGGDWYRYATAYFEQVAAVQRTTKCDIVGHFDLVSKFNEKTPRFDPNHPRYLTAAIDALDTLINNDALIEVNTGAISRGFRRAPYPSPIFLRRIAERGGRVTLSSDAHSAEGLMCAFDTAVQILRASGITSVQVYSADGWKTQML